MAKRRYSPTMSPGVPVDPALTPPSPPRIVGGSMRGRKLLFSGDPRTRPMKDRVREAVFNLLGPQVAGLHAIDLFAGTGALGFEALSRGAAQATFVERHFPTADLIRRTAVSLGVAEQCHVVGADALIWAQRDLPSPEPPWLVFISPPWSLFAERLPDMLHVIRQFVDRSSPGSIVVVEGDMQFDFTALPHSDHWDVRPYAPAQVGIYRQAGREADGREAEQ